MNDFIKNGEDKEYTQRISIVTTHVRSPQSFLPFVYITLPYLEFFFLFYSNLTNPTSYGNIHDKSPLRKIETNVNSYLPTSERLSPPNVRRPWCHICENRLLHKLHRRLVGPLVTRT